MKKNPFMLVLLWLLGVILVGTGGFFIGKNVTETRFQKEQDLNIRLNRSDLEGLGEIAGTIYVTGHKSPDSDTVCSSIAYANLLQQLGYDAKPVVLGEINKESQFILETAGVEVPPLLEDASGENMILVDHSDYTQSAEGLEDANIISIIDHHGSGTVTTGNQMIYDNRPLGATATIIWLRYRNYGLEPDSKTALLMLGAVLSDTRNLAPSSTTEADREAVNALGRIAGISDVNGFFNKMFEAYVSHEGMTDEQLFFNDYKEYEAGGINYGIAIVDVYDEAEAEDMTARMKSQVPSALKSTGMDMLFVMVSVFHDEINKTYLISSDDAADELLQTAYGDKAEFDGLSYVLTPGISRKKDLVPAITDLLNAHPSE